MNPSLVVITLLFVSGWNSWLVSRTLMADDSLVWTQLASIPDRLGIAGPVCGTIGDWLIVAGGANFPDAPPWKDGRKVWYDSVYVLKTLDGQWVQSGRLPMPIGYSVAVSIPPGLGVQPGIAFLGGSNADGHHADCWLLRCDGDRVQFERLPSLPKACANACGALLGDTIYVAGGIEQPDSTTAMHQFWSLNLGQLPLQWRVLAAWPGEPRMLAVAAVQGGAFYMSSGVALSAGPDGQPQRSYLKDAHRYHPDSGWVRIADMPRAAVAAASPAASLGEASFLILGGDDGSLIDFKPLEAHPGFPRSILAYHTPTDTWKTLAAELPASHVTTATVYWQGRHVIPSGELRPGVRTPSVWSFESTIKTNHVK